jgi:8-oxo-dGTP pyrophosphatase MutT (NUDIX family)
MSDEVVDIIDSSGAILTKALRTEAHANGLLHKTVIGWLKTNNDWMLVRQASDRQDPGKLVCPVGGHVSSGESNIEALVREAKEEIGTSKISYKYIGRSTFRRQVNGRDENHLFEMYEIASDEVIKLGLEAVAIERFTTDALKRLIKDSPDDIGLSLYSVLESFYPELLPKDYQLKYKSVL